MKPQPTATNQFTKGPWTPELNNDDKVWRVFPPEESGEARICTVTNCQKQEANARLIASAPDLLAELQKLTGILESILSDQTSLSATDGISELPERDRVSRISFYKREIVKAAEQIDTAMESAQAAIAKATKSTAQAGRE